MRLAVVSPFLDRQHGTELCIIEQMERLARLDRWNVELYSQKVSGVAGLSLASRPFQDSPGTIQWHRVSGIPGPHLFRYLWWFSANQWQRLWDRRSGRVRPDLVYSPGINCLDADVIVVHIVFHAFYEQVRPQLAFRRVPVASWPRLIHRKLYYQLVMFLEQRIYCNARVRLVAVSSLVARELKSHFERSDVTVIPNAVDTSRCNPGKRDAQRQAARQSLGYAEGDFVLLLIGNDWKKKGLDALLKALDQVRDLPLQLLVVGSDEPDFYRPMLEGLGLVDRVRFEKPSPDVLSFYAAGDLYVGPSLEDAFNLPILEAMACGLPVIASAHAGVSELVRDRETGFILHDPQDPRELAQSIRELFIEDALRNSIGKSAALFTQRNCSWDQNAAKTRSFLESVVQQATKS